MKKLRKVAIGSNSNSRGGTTLTEVLMSILCMGIGVVAVASLFPIALLRSVQATQLTSGTILRYNAETLIGIDPQIALNPDFDNNLDEHANPTSPFTNIYLVDPLGATIAAADGRPAMQINQVGNMQRWGLNLTSEAAAENFVTLPDSWVTMHDLFPASNTQDTVTLQNNVPQDVIDTFNAFDTDGDGTLEPNEVSLEALRVVLFNQDGRLSEVRYIRQLSQINNATDITWSTVGSDLPAQYFNNKVSRVRIEVRERRYTWMLTVRNYSIDERDETTGNPTAATAHVDVVIFFRRSPSLEDETTYTLTGSGRTYTVGVAGDRPFLKKGGFMLDTTNGRWHRIATVDEATDPRTITLQRNITTSLDMHEAVFMPGVVEVYELGPKSIRFP